MLIKGEVLGMRPVSGEFKDGKKAGQKWFFLSFEIRDSTTGLVCSCQLRDNDSTYNEYVGVSKGDKGDELSLLQDLTGHVVKATVKKFSTGERSVLEQQVMDVQSDSEKRIGYASVPVVVTRFTITKIVDLGEIKSDDE